MARIPSRRHLPRPKTRKGPGFKPKNERPYLSCKNAMKKFFKTPSKKTYNEYQKAYNALGIINPTASWSFMNLFKKQMFDKALKEEDFQ